MHQVRHGSAEHPSSKAPPPRTLVRFWGTRGSVPTPGPTTVRYGGNTPCVEVRVGNSRIILDAGTGIRELGAAVHRSGRPLDATILLTHFHWDHIHGLPFFHPLHDPASNLVIVAPADRDTFVEERLARQMDPAYFPVPMHGIRAHCSFRAWNDAWGETPLEVGPARVTAMVLRHPSRTLGYRIDTPTGSLCYLPDNELLGGSYDVPPDWRARLEAFVGDADLLVHDAMIEDHEYPGFLGWGHSTFAQALDLARSAGVGRLSCFHHAPERTDTRLDELLDQLRVRNPAGGPRIEMATEGDEILLGA